jgi:hypothetical protein
VTPVVISNLTRGKFEAVYITNVPELGADGLLVRLLVVAAGCRGGGRLARALGLQSGGLA